MSGILDTAISGLNSAAARIANASSSIVNASSTKNISQATQKDLASSLVALNSAKTDYEANAKVVDVTRKLDDALLDITV